MVGILDIVALRSLASVADSGGFRRAAASLHLSQSAVSQHIRRLEQTCGHALVQRHGRTTRFTPEGELLVAEARKILAAHDDALARLRVDAVQTERAFVIGSTEHAADLLLPAITTRLHNEFPGCSIRFRIDRGRRLNERIDQGLIDASLFIGDVHGAGIRPAGQLPLAWYASPDWRPPRAGRPMPVVVIDEPCTIRRRALEALAGHRIDATVVCEAGHLAGVVGAARAGMGVALLAHVGSPPEGLQRRPDLPAIEPEPLHVRGRTGTPKALIAAVAAAASAALVDREPV